MITCTTHDQSVHITHSFTNVEGMGLISTGMIELLKGGEAKQITYILSRVKQHNKQISHCIQIQQVCS